MNDVVGNYVLHTHYAKLTDIHTLINPHTQTTQHSNPLIKLTHTHTL